MRPLPEGLHGSTEPWLGGAPLGGDFVTRSIEAPRIPPACPPVEIDHHPQPSLSLLTMSAVSRVAPGTKMPAKTFKLAGGGETNIAALKPGSSAKLVVVFRGQFCPFCKGRAVQGTERAHGRWCVGTVPPALARAYLLRLRALLALQLRLSTAQLLVPRQSERERVTWVPKQGAGVAGTAEPLDRPAPESLLLAGHARQPAGQDARPGGGQVRRARHLRRQRGRCVRSAARGMDAGAARRRRRACAADRARVPVTRPRWLTRSTLSHLEVPEGGARRVPEVRRGVRP